jgi:hypothetical protein
MKRLAWASIAIAAVLALPAGAMTPDEAYAAIPHRRTLYEPPKSPVAAEKARELGRLFALTDEGVVLRVQGMRAHRERNAAEVRNLLLRYDALIAKLAAEKFGSEVTPARDLIADGVRMHRKFLASRPAGGITFVRNELTATPDVTQASRKLIGAYHLLMAAFPKEAAHNKTAFYDHLCALDYL